MGTPCLAPGSSGVTGCGSLPSLSSTVDESATTDGLTQRHSAPADDKASAATASVSLADESIVRVKSVPTKASDDSCSGTS